MDGFRVAALMLLISVSGCTINAVPEGGATKGSTLDGTQWTLQLFDDANVPMVGRPSLSFLNNGSIRGYAGCNGYHGDAWVSRGGVRFLDIGVQLTACDNPSMELGDRYIKALNQIRGYRMESGKLVLLDGKRDVRLVFKPSEVQAGNGRPGPAPFDPSAYASSGQGFTTLVGPRTPGVTPFIPPIHPGLTSFSAVSGEPPVVARSLPATTVVPFGRFAGFELVTMTPALGKYFGTDRGALVARGHATDALRLLEEGDVILSINNRQPANADHAVRILSSYRAGETVDMEVVRQKKTVTLKIPL
jgi:heat shock protein HslJ